MQNSVLVQKSWVGLKLLGVALQLSSARTILPRTLNLYKLVKLMATKSAKSDGSTTKKYGEGGLCPSTASSVRLEKA